MLSHVTAFLRTSVFELQLLENRFNMYVDHEQNAKQFLRNLMKAMGPDMRFRINVTDYEQSKDDQNIATAFWHLEWDSKEIPFTRGRSVCECGEADEKILIRRFHVTQAINLEKLEFRREVEEIRWSNFISEGPR
ncbi:hypothetical protein OIU77_019750 [Salix suchowensis]|uniref:Uncharacterized protein n=1 Tax=Salix suchowensis TaxID=1278906 RepID=A0ABQ9CHA5_9ROSI|nr:hypothetical protein OIU77_019750 [Salix suchowensis]